MLQTEHYQLSQWDFEDQIVMADFNNDNTKIDAALHGLAEETAGKADSGTVNTLSAAVSQKAEQSALAAEQTARQNADSVEQAARIAADSAEKAAREAADAALKTQVDALTPKAGLQFLRTVTLQTSGSSVYLDLGEIDWNQWKAVHLSLDVYLADTYNVGVEVGGANCGYLYSNDTPPDKGDAHRNLIHIMLYPLYDSRHAVCLIYMSPGNSGISDSTSSFQGLRSIHLHNSNTTVLAGTTCDIWGEK